MGPFGLDISKFLWIIYENMRKKLNKKVILVMNVSCYCKHYTSPLRPTNSGALPPLHVEGC